MTPGDTETTQTAGTAADREVVAAARVLLQRMGVDPTDLMQDLADRTPVPTFDEYIPQVEAAISPGTAGTYGSCWKRIAAKWGQRAGRPVDGVGRGLVLVGHRPRSEEAQSFVRSRVGFGDPDDEFLVGVGAAGEGVPVEGELAGDGVVDDLEAAGAGRDVAVCPPVAELVVVYGQFTDERDESGVVGAGRGPAAQHGDGVAGRGLPVRVQRPHGGGGEDVPDVVAFLLGDLAARASTLTEVAEEQGVRICPIYGDTFDDTVTNYVQMMRFNADSLHDCLG